MLSSATQSVHCQQSSILLTLPAELRNTIYDHVLCQPLLSTSTSSPYSAAQGAKSSLKRFCANILLTCKQANREATPILYGQNIFVAHESLLATMPSMLLTPSPACTYTRPILQPRAISQIKRFYLRVRLDTDPRYSPRQVEESFTGAEELDIEVFQTMFDSCSFANLTLFEGVRGVGKAVVRGSVGDGRYAAWLADTMMMPMDTDAMYDEYLTQEFEKMKPYSWAVERCHGRQALRQNILLTT